MLAWRSSHTCVSKPDPEPDKQGTTSLVEMAYTDPHRDDGWGTRIPQIRAQIGFQPNPAIALMEADK